MCGYKCGYTWATKWLHVEYELLSKCMVTRDGYMLVTCWLHVICVMKKLKFNYIMIEGQSSTTSFSFIILINFVANMRLDFVPF